MVYHQHIHNKRQSDAEIDWRRPQGLFDYPGYSSHVCMPLVSYIMMLSIPLVKFIRVRVAFVTRIRVRFVSENTDSYLSTFLDTW